jgi:hypothetical protein
MFLVGGMNFMLNGIGRDNVDRFYSFGDGFLGGKGVVLGRLGGGGPWLSRLGGLSLVGEVVVTLYVAVFHVQGALPPLFVDASSWFCLIHLALAQFAICLKIKNKNPTFHTLDG